MELTGRRGVECGTISYLPRLGLRVRLIGDFDVAVGQMHCIRAVDLTVFPVGRGAPPGLQRPATAAGGLRQHHS